MGYFRTFVLLLNCFAIILAVILLFLKLFNVVDFNLVNFEIF